MQYFFEYDFATESSYNSKCILTDSEGFLIPVFKDTSQISQLEFDILDDLIAECQDLLSDNLLSIFFRECKLLNSKKLRFVTMLIVRKNDPGITTRLNYLGFLLKYKYTFVTDFNTIIIGYDQLLLDRYAQFVIRILSIRVFGEALEELFSSRFTLNEDVIYSMKVLEKKIVEAKDLSYTSMGKNVVYKRLVNHLIRGSFEIIMHQEKLYTRDLKLCSELFTKYYPEYQPTTNRLMSYLSCNAISYSQFFQDVEYFFKILKQESLKHLTIYEK